MTSVRKKALEAGNILMDNFDALKYSPRGTYWGVCYFWDLQSKELLGEPANSGLEEVVQEIFTTARELGREIVKPSMLVPRSRNLVAHYSMLCIRNRGIVTDMLADITDGKSAFIDDVITDRKLLDEALSTYASMIEKKVIPATTDLFSFMLHYTPGKAFTDEKKPEGRYMHLLERVALAAESRDALEHISENSDGTSFMKAFDLHREACAASKIVLDPELKEAYERYGNGKNGIVHDEQPIAIATIGQMLGKRRIKMNNTYDSCIDWEAYAQKFARRKRTRLADPNRILGQRLVNTMTIKYIEDFRRDSEGTVRRLQAMAEITENKAEQKALYTTIRLLQLMQVYDSSGRIHHRMHITGR